MFAKALSLGLLGVLVILGGSAIGQQAASAPASAPAAAMKFPEQWNSISGSCRTAEDTQKLIAKLQDSLDVGCNHVLLNEAGIGRIEEQHGEYFDNVKKVLAFAKEHNLTLTMGMVSIGYSGTYFHYDVNLAAGNPVKNMPYLVKGKTAKPDPAAALPVKNPSFHEVADGKLVGWIDAPQTLLDENVRFHGQPTLKGGTVLHQSVKCEPFQYYRATWYVKGPKAEDDEKYFLTVLSSDGKRRHTFTEATQYAPDKDGWQKCEVPFNTYEAKELDVRFGGGKEGENWFADLKIEPAGMLLLIQRDRAPLVVTSEDGKTVYEQGKDFQHVVDPIMAVKPFPGEFPLDHEAPAIDLTDDSRIKDGQKLLVSFFHHIRIYTDEDGISLEDPAVWPILERQIKLAIQAWPTGHYFLNYDEIRAGGWEPMPDPSIKTPGQLLAWHFKKSYDLVKKYDPSATVYTWTDMFTPYHNAGNKDPYYYYVNGNWYGAHEGFPKDVVVMQWYAPTAEAMKFFADRGNKQIMCGFYDDKTTEGMKKNIRQWMEVSQGVPNVEGFMYTTFQGNWKSMPEYFKLLATYNEWGQSTGPTSKMIMHGVEDR